MADRAATDALCASDPQWAHLQAPQVVDVLTRHGYDPTALPSGVSGPPSVWEGANGVRLRPHVCYLDGVKIDGHEGSDLDPGDPECIHCGEEDTFDD